MKLRRGFRELRGPLATGGAFLVCLTLFENGPRNAFHNAVPITVGLPSAMLFLAAYSFSLAGLVILFATESRAVRWCTYVLFGSTSALNLGFLWIVKAPYNVVAAHIVLDSLRTENEIGGTLSLFRSEIVVVTLAAALLTAGLSGVVRWLLPRTSVQRLWVPLLGFSLSAWLVFRSGSSYSEVPMPFKVPLVTAQVLGSQVDRGPKEAPRFPPRNPPLVRHILYLVDESITGSALSVNGFPRDTTPFLRGIADRYLNLGIVAAGANGSSPSNHILLSGLQLRDVPDRDAASLRAPNLFQYAKAAGLTTHFRACSYDNAGFMGDADRAFIDDKGAISLTPWYLKDRALADQVVEMLQDAERTGKGTFIYATKLGAHYHYEYTYPREETVFTPTAPYPRWYMLFPTWDVHRMENSYYNGLRYAVDGFFQYLLPKLEGLDVLILYTADHGQTMPTRLEPSTHGTAQDPPSQQANVPLLLFPLGEGVRRATAPLLQQAAGNANKVSHFQLFSTVLLLMGYDQADVVSSYGPTIFDPPPAPRHFVSGDLFGRSATFKNVFEPTPWVVE
jgi:hypothetical protein